MVHYVVSEYNRITFSPLVYGPYYCTLHLVFNANMKLATQVHKELHTGMNGVIFLNGCNPASPAPQIELPSFSLHGRSSQILFRCQIDDILCMMMIIILLSQTRSLHASRFVAACNAFDNPIKVALASLRADTPPPAFGGTAEWVVALDRCHSCVPPRSARWRLGFKANMKRLHLHLVFHPIPPPPPPPESDGHLACHAGIKEI